MEAMRVYEFARLCGVPSKELVVFLNEAGFHIKSHMAVLSKQEFDFLEKRFMQTEQQQKIVEPVVAIEEHTPIAEKKSAKNNNLKQEVLEGSILIEPMSVADFANKTKKPTSEVIITLLKMGIMAAKNQVITEDSLERLAEHYHIKTVKKEKVNRTLPGIDVVQNAIHERPPVVVVVGHVDHGKTTFLDYVRKANVAAREKGGITQHLGAYEVKTSHGTIVFLDTPGHEAFSKIRGRGIGVADIAILMVAADDGVMPQTIEAIKFAKEANLPIIVAINKIDKVDASRLESVRSGLAQHGILATEWGGDVMCLPISAKTGAGIEQLLEMIILQSQVMELRADQKIPGIGHVLESKPERGRGAVATVLCKHGIVRVGDYFIAGDTVGKITTLTDSTGKRIKEVLPGIPVQVSGFSALPAVGSLFRVISQAEYSEARSSATENKVFAQKLFADDAFNMILKTDSLSTKEALIGSLEKISQKIHKDINIVLAGVGDVTESDIMLASYTGSAIFALHVKSESNATLLARRSHVHIHVFDIIYKLLEDIEVRLKKPATVQLVTTKVGEAVVRQVFTIKKIGVVAGCYVQEGKFTRDASIKVFRRGKEVGSGNIKSLQRERRSVKEVHAGYECGFVVDGFEDFQVEDRIECFLEQPAS